MKTVIVGIAACAVLAFVVIASAQDQASIAAGEALYDEHCAMCHGEKLRDSGSFPDLRELRADQRTYFVQIVTDGKGQMPAWGGQLNEKELDQIWAYIQSRARR